MRKARIILNVHSGIKSFQNKQMSNVKLDQFPLEALNHSKKIENILPAPIIQ